MLTECSSPMRSSNDDAEIRSLLAADDQEDLEWFFGKGQCCFERSTFGPQLERAELFSFGVRLCPTCDGRGYRESMDASIRKAIAKLERWQSDNAERIAKGKAPRLPPAYDDGTCPTCQGGRFVPRTKPLRAEKKPGPITARPMGFEIRPAPGEPRGDDLERYGLVSVRLRDLPEQTVAVLTGFFGWGANWKDDRKLGAIFGVEPLTPAGKTLLRRSRGRSHADEQMADDFLLATEVELELTQPKPGRAVLLAKARTQAVEMLRAAERDWNDVALRRKRREKPVAQREPSRVRKKPIKVVDLRIENQRRFRELVIVERTGASA